MDAIWMPLRRLSPRWRRSICGAIYCIFAAVRSGGWWQWLLLANIKAIWSDLNGTLATTRLDNDLHVWHGIRVISGAVLAGVHLGAWTNILMGKPQSATLNRSELVARLRQHDQEHLLRFWDELDATSCEQLARQIGAIDFARIAALFGQTAEKVDWAALARRAVPPPAIRLTDRVGNGPMNDVEARRRGLASLKAGQIGIILVAGGQGSRLGFEHPKGMFPIGPISGASLMQIHLEKALAASRKYGASIPVYMMTSPVTHDEQVEFLSEHNRFGFPTEDLVVFCQGTMPAVDAATGKLLLAGKDSLFLSPDGHGGTVAALASSGAIKDMRRRGIEHLFYCQVDNPLTPICDPEFIGYHLLADSELTSMAVAKQGPKDKVGNFVAVDGRVQVIEYSDFPDDVADQRLADNALAFWAGSIAIHVFAVSFLERGLALKDALPFHIANKKVPHIDDRGRRIEPTKPNALKFERFIFDLLPHAENPLVVEFVEADVFAPVKNAPGADRDTPEYVQQFMSNQHRRWLQAAGVRVAENIAVEISPLWALDAESVTARPDLPQSIDKPTYLSDR
jgi:UDP-N-acetylglucosamine/UDP-N-acetylgalactosamine diphosphorylase